MNIQDFKLRHVQLFCIFQNMTLENITAMHTCILKLIWRNRVFFLLKIRQTQKRKQKAIQTDNNKKQVQ